MITAVRDAWIVTQDPQRRIIRGDVVIENEKITSVGGRYGGSADTDIDASGDIVMPGLINTHTHVAMSVMRGAADDISFPNFIDRVFRIDSERTDRDIEIGTKIGCAEMIRSGTTTFVDLYYSEDVIARATAEAGIRGVLCWCVLDDELTTQRGSPMQNCKRFCESFRNRRKIIPGVGLQGVYVCGEDTCKGAKEFSDEKDIPLTFHLSETRGEVNDLKKKTGRRPAEWLSDIGVLGKRSIAAHSSWLTMNEVKLMAAAGISVSSCPVSNMKLATGGVAPIPEFQRYGVNVTVGTDGSTTNNSLDMISEMKILGLLQKSSRWDPTVASAQELMDFATVNASIAIGMQDLLGSIEVGKYADLVILDGKSPNIRPLLPENMVSNIIYSASPANVKTVICQGDTVLRDGKIKTVDEEDILSMSEDMWGSLCRR
ncbi:MAG: amidohydrolase family protein [Candidatus Methanoplasma sp.]|jgi:5-methylthioadenosine/S-adenosylhomocysteine deaminase|nr:amidohydrolase family protein [Candidatus Methanoplasma sp.]